MTDLARLWSDITTAAMLLDLPAIRSAIEESVDTGIRAASYDGPGGRSADTSSHPERQVLNPHRDPAWADLSAVDHHEQRFVTAVAELTLRSRSGRPADCWDDAVKDAHLLAEMDAVGVLDRTGQKPARWVLLAGDCIHDLEVIARRHTSGRAPTEDEKNWERTNPNDVCTWHLAVHARHRRPRRKGSNICDTCATLVIAGEGARPPAWLLEAEVDREAKPKAWTAALSRWLDELGVRRDRTA